MDVDRATRTVTVFTQATEEERTAAVKATVDFWREKKTFKVLEGWRNELYPCYGPSADYGRAAESAANGKETTGKDYELLWNVERAASALFGIATYGVHLTAYTQIDEQRQKEEGTKWDKLIWIPRRSKTKQTYPGMLDNTVAGGIASGEDIMECCKLSTHYPQSKVISASRRNFSQLLWIQVMDFTEILQYTANAKKKRHYLPQSSKRMSFLLVP